MALAEVDGLGAADPMAGQSPTRAPGRSPQRSSRASATSRCAPCPAGGTQVLVEGVLDEGVGEAVAARGVGRLAHQGDGRGGVEDVEQLVLEVFVALARTSRSKSRPITAAIDKTRSASGPKPPDPSPDHLTDAVGQSHLCPGGPRAIHRPVASW